MSIRGRVQTSISRAVMWAALGVIVFAIVLSALGLLVAGLFVWIEQIWPHKNAAAITGGVLLLLAVLVFLLGGVVLRKSKRPQPSILAEFTGMAGLAGRVAGMLIRRDPRKSLVLAVIAGAVAEYLTSGDHKRK